MKASIHAADEQHTESTEHAKSDDTAANVLSFFEKSYPKNNN
jgi:hypothetical protein